MKIGSNSKTQGQQRGLGTILPLPSTLIKKTKKSTPWKKNPNKQEGKRSWFRIYYKKNGFWSSRHTYKIHTYNVEKVGLLAGKRHRTHNYLEKEYGVEIEIPDFKYYDQYYTIDIRCRAPKPKRLIIGALKEVYAIVGS